MNFRIRTVGSKPMGGLKVTGVRYLPIGDGVEVAWVGKDSTGAVVLAVPSNCKPYMEYGVLKMKKGGDSMLTEKRYTYWVDGWNMANCPTPTTDKQAVYDAAEDAAIESGRKVHVLETTAVCVMEAPEPVLVPAWHPI